MFYKIVIKPQPKEHQTGPWCPRAITDSKENGGAAKPNVECLSSYYTDITNTYFISVNPIYKERSSRLGREGIGLAFNGVKFDGSAPDVCYYCGTYYYNIR